MTVAVPPSGRCRIVVVADTHSAPHPDALDLVRRERPDRILHAGDIGRLEVLDAFAEVAPVIAVRGNIDPPNGPPDSIDVELRSAAGLLARWLLVHIAVNGPRLRADALRLARRYRAQLVICGHSHVPLIASSGGVAVFNPGSVGPRRFLLPIVFGVCEVEPTGISFRHVDCETGDTWHPAPPV